MHAFAEILDGQVFQAEATQLLVQHDKVVGVETSAGQIRGDVILTAGEGTEALLSELSQKCPVMQRRPSQWQSANSLNPFKGIRSPTRKW